METANKLYHFVSVDRACRYIVPNDVLTGSGFNRITSFIKKKNNLVYFTRSPVLYPKLLYQPMSPCFIRLTIDRDKLHCNYRIRPYNYFKDLNNFRFTINENFEKVTDLTPDQLHKAFIFEEVVTNAPIKHLSKYIIEINFYFCNKMFKHILHGRDEYVNKLIEYCNVYNIKYSMDNPLYGLNKELEYIHQNHIQYDDKKL